MSETISTQKTYDSLKDFQQDTVEFAYERLKNNGRYLVADEVGLGKTMIAKGIIAKTYDELKNKKDTIEIVYITTNQSIASQNIETLKFQNTEATSHRLTLHVTKPKIKNQKINFMSFTVGTSIEIRGSGNHTEREFLVYLLRHKKYNLLKGIPEKTIWKFFKQGVDSEKNFMENNNFHVSRKYLNEKFYVVDENTSFIERFVESVKDSEEIKEIMKDIRNLNLFVDDSYNIIEVLRKILLIENLNDIKPKLIILDEFQRFNKILVDSSHSEENQNDGLDKIMEMLFNQSSKILLLSATPYKLLDCKDNEHYTEFYGLIHWLYKYDNEITNTLKELFLNLHVKKENKGKIETLLKNVMCRTERYSFQEDNFEELIIEGLEFQNTMKHYLKEYAKYSSLNIQGVTRYLKSAPSALNYMNDKGYVAKREFLQLNDNIKSNIRENKKHPKLQMLNQEVKNQKLKEFIWMPPLSQYVKARGVSSSKATKILIFSQWDFVPDSIVGSFSTRTNQTNYTNKKLFTNRDKLLRVVLQDKNPYNYDEIITFTELINKTKREYNISELDAKILLGSPANVIYRSIWKYGNIDDLETLKFYIEPYEEIKDEDWKSFSHLFLHHLGKSENYHIMELEKNESNKLEKILEYCIKNNIQSMFDEYFHLLTDSPRYKNIHDDKSKILYLLDNFQTIFNMGHYSVRSDDFIKNKKNIKASKFAMRISKSSMIAKGDKKLPTANNVKTSFNSPFAPFILATTSIGQEGLDFHSYCHQIWHWDLPSNPVDLEQREGRINRYKNYAVRKNIAKSFNNKCWIKKFENAKKEKECDFTTFWIYESEVSPEKIQRVIPKMPLSREYYKYEHLKNQLKLYRGVMGQKKQNEKMITSENIDIPQISLKPPKSLVKER